MKKLVLFSLLFFILFTLMISCSSKQNKYVFLIRNHQVSQCNLPYIVDDPSPKIRIRGNKSLLITDQNGFTIPYQRIDSSKVMFLLNIKSAEAKKYTFKATKLPIRFDTLVRYFTDSSGDVFWENDKVLFRMHSSRKKGIGGGIDYIAKPKNGFVNKDSLAALDSYAEGNTLGCGGIAPILDSNLVRYGNFEKMEVIDSGPILLRLRFTFPEFEYDGHKIREERTVSLVQGQVFSRIQSRYIGTDSLDVAIGIPLKDAAGNPADSLGNSNSLFPPISQTGRGFICYAENYANGRIGTIFSAVAMSERRTYRNKIIDGHNLMIYSIKDSQSVFYYQGASNSYMGMNYDMWRSEVDAFSNHVKSSLTCNSYESE